MYVYTNKHKQTHIGYATMLLCKLNLLKSQYGLVVIRSIMCGMKLIIYSETATVAPLKFGNGIVISTHTLLGMWLLIDARIKVNPC